MNRVSHIPNSTCYNSSPTKNAQKNRHIVKSPIFTWTLWGQSPVLQGKYMIPMRCEKTLLRLNLLEVTSGQTLGVFRQISWEGVEWWATGEKKIYIYLFIYIYIYTYEYMRVVLNSFIWKTSSSPKKSFAELSRTPCFSFAVHVGQDF